jgi:enoyl-CoA hydratase
MRASMRMQEAGFKATVERRDSGRPIPEGDEARTLIEELQQDRSARDHGQVCV